MEIKLIKDLMGHMSRTGTKRLSVQGKDFKVEIEQHPTASERKESEQSFFENPLRPELELHRVQTSPARPMIKASEDKIAIASQDNGGTYITSPMVGTFYRAPSPDAAPFVKEGDTVKKGDVICIIEAMKVMNEVKAELSGTVKKVLVDSGHPVEFGTKLYLIG